MNYSDMIKNAKAKGATSEDKMWRSIDALSEALQIMEQELPDQYWAFMRKQHGILYGGHYDEMFANEDVSKLHYTDAQGKEHKGPHWNADDVEAATAGFTFDRSVTKWDKYVAFNTAYADLAKHFTDAQILQAGYDLYFADEDWPGNSKIWEYTCLAMN